MKNLLPKKLSDCIDVALKDLDDAKKLGFKVDMGRWYSRGEKTCTVCLAGAVLAREFDLDEFEEVGPTTLYDSDGLITEHDAERLHALNQLRGGNINEALHMVGRSKFFSPPDIDTQSTGNMDTKQWRKDMSNIRDYLRKLGL